MLKKNEIYIPTVKLNFNKTELKLRVMPINSVNVGFRSFHFSPNKKKKR